MPTGTQINATSSSLADGLAPDVFHHAFTYAGGQKIAVFRHNTGTKYSTKPSGGSWNAVRGAVTGDPMGSAFSWTGVEGDNFCLWDLSGTVLRLTKFSNAATPVITQYTFDFASISQSASNINGSLDAFYNSTNNWWYVVCVGSTTAARPILYCFQESGALLVQQGIADQFVTTPVGTCGRIRITGLSATATTLYVAVNFTANNTVYLWPCTVNAAYPAKLNTTLARETVYSGQVAELDMVVDNDGSGNLELIVMQTSGPTTIYCVKRSGSNTYTTVAIVNANVLGTGFAAAYNAASPYDLWVYYRSNAAQTNGEIYVVKRVGGIWGTPILAVGGDATGYSAPSTSALFDATPQADLLYVNGTANPYNIYAAGVSGSGTPNAPTNLAPSGNVAATGTNPTPTFSWTYSNPVANDTQGSYQVIVKNAGVTTWDSGKVASSAASIVYGTGGTLTTNLAYSTTYTYTVQVWDSVNGALSATASGSFTPVRGPSGSITAIASPTATAALTPTAASTLNGATLANATSLVVQAGKGAAFTVGQQVAVGVSPNIDLVTISAIATDTLTVGAMTHAHSNTDPVVQAYQGTSLTITAQSMDITFEVQQADGHSINYYQLVTYDGSGTVVVDTTAKTLLSPAIAPGNTFTVTNYVSSHMVNSTPYLIGLLLWDAVNNSVYFAAQWSVTTGWSAPASPSSIITVVNNDAGNVTLSWTNPGGITSTNVFWRKTGTTPWIPLSSGTIRSTITTYPPVNVSYDYAISTVNALGIVSAMMTTTATLGLKYGGYGHWLNDVSNPSGLNVALGGVEDWTSATAWTHVEDVLRYVPQGRTKPIVSYGKADWWHAHGRKYFVPNIDTGATGASTTLTSVMSSLATMNANHSTLLYRDTLGNWRYVTLDNYAPETTDSIHGVVQFDLDEVGWNGSPPVV